MNQMPLEPSAVEEAIEEAVATGKTPFWQGYQRAGKYDDRKRWPIEKMAADLIEPCACLHGARPDQIACAPCNVEALERSAGMRVVRRPEGPAVSSADVIFFGSAAWS